MFKKFRKKLQGHLTMMCNQTDHLFVVKVDKEEMWNLYLDSFPEGTNEIFRERREHDCNCCRNFVRNLGNVVMIKDNVVTTIWNFQVGDTTYQPVVDALNAYIMSKEIVDVYVGEFEKVGTDHNFEEIEGKSHQWNHLNFDLPAKFVNKTKKSIGELQGEYRAIHDVFEGSLSKISPDSLETILDLIAQGSLYKGEEWQKQLTEFLKYKKAYDVLSEEEKVNFIWEQSVIVGPVIGKIKNHSIGTLLVDVTEGTTLDIAVRAYEKMTAGPNYKRVKPVYSERQLKDAREDLQREGYLEFLARRHAHLDDITANNILFSNKDVAKKLKGAANVFDEMANDINVKPRVFSKVEEISIADFVKNVLPTATELEVYLENKHASNMVSLIAPENIDCKTMLKWDNGFSWAYSGNITDSDITERVKAAGGRVDGVLRFSHSWNYEGMRNGSLMDLHVFMPGSSQSVTMKNGKEIHENYGNDERVGWNHRKHSVSGGVQDVDYVDVAPVGYIPVENTTFPSMDKLREGIYTFKIHNWKLRQPTTGGFKAEIAFGGNVYRFTRKEPLEHHEWITLAKLELKNGEFKILEMAENDTTSIDIWNLKTNKFVPVSVVMYSPNYWNEQDGIGHRHYFFMLKDCINPENPNGFYNEFLKQDMMKHKHVLEALGGKMSVEGIENQLSGLGFSATQRKELTVKVKGTSERVLKIKF